MFGCVGTVVIVTVSCLQVLPYLLVECTPTVRVKFASSEMLLLQFKSALNDALRISLDSTVPSGNNHTNTESDASGDGDGPNNNISSIMRRCKQRS